MAEPPFLSIIICTYNRADYLRDTLQSLLNTSADPESFEVLMIDNNSRDETPKVVNQAGAANEHFRIRYEKETKQGLSHARNRGISEAAAPVLLFLDDDIATPSDFIRAWLSFFKQHPDASGGGGKIHVQFDDPRPDWMSHFLLPLLGHHDLGNSIKKYPSGKHPFGGNMAFRREVFERYGNFNTELGRKGKQLMASEEKEFYRRLPDDEEIYYLPEAFIYHRVNNERLTKAYIKKQALGLGKSIALQMEKASALQKFGQLVSELFKSLATAVLCVGYSLALQFPKAALLVQFRRWIWEGYREG
jgi:glycosyltransferase involved in cell wall biosynthesis